MSQNVYNEDIKSYDLHSFCYLKTIVNHYLLDHGLKACL